MRINNVKRELIPPNGGTVLASSINTSLSIHVQRAALKRYLPRSTRWRNPSGPGLSVAWLPNGNKIVFVTNDSGARAMQGYAAALVWLDEEHDETVYNEALQRVSRVRWDARSGWLLLTMTPLKGMGSWVYRRFVQEPDEGTKVHHIHGADNPFIDQDKRERILKGYGEHERLARDVGAFTSLEGLVYGFQRDLHVVDPFTPPEHWPRYAAIDFGTRNPFVYLLCAVDPGDDVLHVYRAHYKTEWTLRQHVEVMREITDVWPSWIVADCEDKGSRLSLAREHDFITIPSKKGAGSVRAGINSVAERLAPDVEGRPHLVVHNASSCRPVIKEFMSYRWDKTRSERNQPDAPLKRDDHAMDALRYLCSHLQRSTFATG
jgi:phage terminase large subunit